MSFFTEQHGQTKTVLAALDSTDPTTLYTVSNGIAALKSISFCEVSGNATTYTLTISDGTNTADIFNAKALSANGHEILTDHNPILKEGWSISVTAGDADRVEIVLVLAENAGLQ